MVSEAFGASTAKTAGSVQYCNKPKKGKREATIEPVCPSCSVVSRPSLTVAARAASLDTPCVRDGVSILPVGARESLRRGRTREMTKRGGSRIRSITSSLCLCCRDERTPENKRSLPRGCSGDRWRRPSDRNPNGPRPAARGRRGSVARPMPRDRARSRAGTGRGGHENLCGSIHVQETSTGSGSSDNMYPAEILLFLTHFHRQSLAPVATQHWP